LQQHTVELFAIAHTKNNYNRGDESSPTANSYK